MPVGRIVIVTAALGVAAVPAWWGLSGNSSLTTSVDDPTRTAVVVTHTPTPSRTPVTAASPTARPTSPSTTPRTPTQAAPAPATPHPSGGDRRGHRGRGGSDDHRGRGHDDRHH